MLLFLLLLLLLFYFSCCCMFTVPLAVAAGLLMHCPSCSMSLLLLLQQSSYTAPAASHPTPVSKLHSCCLSNLHSLLNLRPHCNLLLRSRSCCTAAAPPAFPLVPLILANCTAPAVSSPVLLHCSAAKSHPQPQTPAVSSPVLLHG